MNKKVEPTPEINIPQLRQSSRLRVTDVVTTPPVILRVDNSIIGTLGNFSASTGKAKSKKTFNVCAIVASALSNSKVLHYEASLPENKRKILYVDTEQSPYHCQKVIKRILKLADFSLSEQPEQLEFLSLRRYSPKIRLAIVEEAIYNNDGLGLVIIDGIRDMAYDINSPSEATDLITKLMQWTDEKQLHIHTVLHLNKGDDNTRGHLGTELNNKAETVLQVTKDDIDRDISSVSSMCIRDIDFEPFVFRINEYGLPESVEDYEPQKVSKRTTFDYHEVSEEKHREALELMFSQNETINYGKLISELRRCYGITGYKFGDNKAKLLKVFLDNKRMILRENGTYKFNPDFKY